MILNLNTGERLDLLDIEWVSVAYKSREHEGWVIVQEPRVKDSLS